MADSNRNSDGKNKAILVKSGPRLLTRAQAYHLQKELDHLALLLDEVKRQTEKVEAAADAIGDTLISQLYIVAEGKNRGNPEAGRKTGSRRALRSVPEPTRHHDLERAQG
jgi:hypothetical protein